MSLDDIIYVIVLLAGIGAGNYIKKIKNESERKIACTALGLAMIIIVSGFHSLHCFIAALIGGGTMLYIHPSNCHLATFIAMFGYLVFFRLVHLFGLPSPPGHTNMIQMILTLKVSGLAFEKTAAWKKFREREKQVKDRKDPAELDKPIVELTDYDVEVQDVTFMDLIHYSFNYIGVLTGPYYRYRTYRDYFEYPFKDYAPNVLATVEKLKYAGFYCVLYLIANYIWPLDYALSDEFYAQRSFFYRLWYVWPTFFIFRMRMYTGLTLSECVCTMAGFGAYPDDADVTNGEGPRMQNYAQLKRDADKRSYNFTTIVNLRAKDVEACWTFREGMKHWNICVQYWLAVNVYKLFPSKKWRTAATLLCSSYWHGFRPGHYFCIMGAPFYVPVEDIWNSLIRKDATGTKRRCIDMVFWFFKFFAFSYLGTAFLLVSFENIWKFYSSVYHVGYISWAIFAGVGYFLLMQKKAAERRRRKAEQPPQSGSGTVEAKEKSQ